MQSFSDIFSSFNDLKVLVIGDVMLDSYLYGKVDRISPEAPVPIVAVDRREDRLGGAANVALNIAAMGAKPILCSVVGDDNKANDFVNLLKENNISSEAIIKSKDRITTVKFRVIGNNSQMLRVDEEIVDIITQQEEELLLNTILSYVEQEKVDAIVFEDYDKGLITRKLIDKVVSAANRKKIPTTVDPKKNNFLAYKNVTLFKPNLKELKEGLKLDHLDPQDKDLMSKAMKQIMEELNLKLALVTLSEYGVMICELNDDTGGFDFQQIPAHVRNISDVSGAGDTVISVATLCLAMNMQPYYIAAISNLAGGIVCEEIGAVPINKEKLLKEATEKLNT